MVASHPVHYSFREYVAHDDASNTKHEYLDGQIYAMAGGTPEHSALIAAVTRLIKLLEPSRCRVHSADLRIRVAETGLATYPDVTVICGPWQRDPDDRNTVLNPIVVVEVLSPNTERYDRGEKLSDYLRIPSLRACALVAHDRREIEVHSRAAADAPWVRAVCGPGTSADLVVLAPLDVDALYDAAAEPS